MHEKRRAHRSELEAALDCLNTEIEEGLQFGFFDLTVKISIVSGEKRRMLIAAGKNHQFTIRKEELRN